MLWIYIFIFQDFPTPPHPDPAAGGNQSVELRYNKSNNWFPVNPRH